MKTIYKYELPIASRAGVQLPKNAIILSIDTQAPSLSTLLPLPSQSAEPEELYIWALVETENEMESRTFLIYGTGHMMAQSIYDTCPHIATVQAGPFVWHIFEELPGDPYFQRDSSPPTHGNGSDNESHDVQRGPRKNPQENSK